MSHLGPIATNSSLAPHVRFGGEAEVGRAAVRTPELPGFVASNRAFCDFGHRAFQRGASKLFLVNTAEHWEGVMKNLFGLLLAVALAAGAATLVAPHPSAATPILADYSGASY